jgi:hypothetical protein
MTQEQALAEAKIIMSPIAHKIAVSRTRQIGCAHGHANQFHVWEFGAACEVLASSTTSWEHCIAVLRADREEIWPAQTEPFEDEAVQS